MKLWLARPVHISWFIAAASMGVIIGTALCLVVKTELFAGVEWLVVATMLLVIAGIRRPRYLLGLALAAGLTVGLSRGTQLEQDFAQYQPYYGKTIRVSGKVVDDASYGSRGDQRLRVGNVQIEKQALAGEMWASLGAPADIKRGDRVVLEGNLSAGFGNVQATMFRADVQDVTRPHPGDIGREFRDWFAAGIVRAIPAPEANLGTGYLVGQKTALPDDLQQEIRITGLTHAVVASGYNLMILVIFARRRLSNYSKYLATLAGGLMIAGFMMISGLSPSMSRAGLVAGLGLLVWYYGRKTHPVVLLSFAAATTLLIRPSYAWGDVGWLLSFAAFAGVIILAPLVHTFFWGKERRPGFIRELIIGTMCAQLITLPIIMYVFGQYSIYALPANLLVLPVVPFAMLATFIAGVGALLVPPLAGVFGLPANILLSYSTFVIEKIAHLPHAQGEVELAAGYIGICYGLILLIMVVLWYRTKHNFRTEKNSIELI